MSYSPNFPRQYSDTLKMYLVYAMTVAYLSNFSLPITFTFVVHQIFPPPKYSHVQYIYSFVRMCITYVCIHVCTYICMYIFCKTFMQRITKKSTPNFQGFTNLCKALTVMKEVAEDIDEAMKMYDRTQVNLRNFYPFAFM